MGMLNNNVSLDIERNKRRQKLIWKTIESFQNNEEIKEEEINKEEPYMKQDIISTNIEKMNKEITSLKNDIAQKDEQNQKSVKEKDEQIEKMNKEITSIKKYLAQKVEQIEKMENEISSLTNDTNQKDEQNIEEMFFRCSGDIVAKIENGGIVVDDFTSGIKIGKYPNKSIQQNVAKKKKGCC